MLSKVELPDNGSSVFARPQDLAMIARVYGAIETTTEDLVRVLETTNGVEHPELIVTLEQTSDWIWREVQGVPVRFLPAMKDCLRNYERTLVELWHCLHSKGVSHDLIRRLEGSIQALQATLQGSTHSKSLAPQQSSNCNFFPDSRNVSIAGGIFTINHVAPDSNSEAHTHSRKISQLQFQICVLFGSSGHKWWDNNRVAWL